jgi:hypothetical protein
VAADRHLLLQPRQHPSQLPLYAAGIPQSGHRPLPEALLLRAQPRRLLPSLQPTDKCLSAAAAHLPQLMPHPAGQPAGSKAHRMESTMRHIERPDVGRWA